MADTFPPSLLPPESAPWGRSIQEATVANHIAVGDSKTQVSNVEKVQAEQGRQIAIGLSDLNRDINAANEQLNRKYIELTNADSALTGRMNSAFEYLTQFSALLGNHGPRIGALESKLNLATASSIDGMEFVAVSGGTWYKVPQSVGSPLGGPLKLPFPLAGITDFYGPRDSPGGIGSTYHRGVDWGAQYGTDIRATGRGVVVQAGPNGGLGNWVKIRHSPTTETGYGHLSSIGVSVGQAVSQGQSIGVMGTTGTSTGVHLHWEVHINGVQVDPLSVVTGGEHL